MTPDLNTPIGLVLLAFYVIFAAAWLFFPFMVRSYLKDIARRLRSIETELENITRNTRPPGSTQQTRTTRHDDLSL